MPAARRWILLAALLAVGATWVVLGSRPKVVPGVRADIDPAPFNDAVKDARPPSAVIRAQSGSSRSRRPNVVLILADDLGYGDLAAYGGKVIRTPNLDRLAAEGVRFTHFYSSASVCSPSRAGLLTGRYPVRTGVTYVIFASDVTFAHRRALSLSRLGTRIGTSEFYNSFVNGIPDSEITLPEALKLAGYATGMVGKWHLGDFSHDRRYLPTRHGFDFYEGIPHSNDEFPVSYWRNDRELSPNVGLAQEQLTADFTKAAVGFIEANKSRPFFLYVAHKDVHVPFFPSQRFRGRSAAGPFGDAVEELDWSVGEIMRALEERGLRENTLVIFTSDNGPWYAGSTEGLRGRKGMQLEGGQRVPMVASWPGRLPAGTQSAAPSMNIDLFPTLLRIAGLTLPSDRVVDGKDVWGAMTGTDPQGPHEALLFFNDKVIAGVRGGDWKYYRHVNRYYWPAPIDAPGSFVGRRLAEYTYTDPTTGQTIKLVDDSPLLYDLRLDPAESYNVADRQPAEAARLLDYIEAWERDFFANPRGWR